MAIYVKTCLLVSVLISSSAPKESECLAQSGNLGENNLDGGEPMSDSFEDNLLM